eukprot:snap_masked-scaffold_6-processed-gene-17.14-mRNA-1 protein AED:1.00 eAED:1.00 QI:0/0/0/0/1/1/3/0/78
MIGLKTFLFVTHRSINFNSKSGFQFEQTLLIDQVELRARVPILRSSLTWFHRLVRIETLAFEPIKKSLNSVYSPFKKV